MDPFVTDPDHPACGISPSRRLRREDLDAAAGTHLIRADIAEELGYPEELEPLVYCTHNLDGWEESWGVSFEELSREAVEVAKQFLNKRSAAQAGS
ncbi:hypothetical protein [Streptomyces sp. NPDC090093]|uniref:hypothetical protein n=1 Tax=Streptomyces sp. NPDC090093 TaxID=3365945 RepID=UPI0037FA0251